MRKSHYTYAAFTVAALLASPLTYVVYRDLTGTAMWLIAAISMGYAWLVARQGTED